MEYDKIIVDNKRHYNRCLTADEIWDLFNNWYGLYISLPETPNEENPASEGLAAFWSADDVR